MREILFRGKKYYNNEWIYGFLINFKNSATEICYEYDEQWEDNNCECVIPDTVGEYTGLKDIDGNKVFEGDIVRIEHDKQYAQNVEIAFEGGEFFFNNQTERMFQDFTMFNREEKRYYLNAKIIGNIYDNPELLEE